MSRLKASWKEGGKEQGGEDNNTLNVPPPLPHLTHDDELSNYIQTQTHIDYKINFLLA